MGRKIEVVDYNSEWVEKFNSEASRLTEILKDELVEIHHIGSTSIPNIKAKPVIDILILIKKIDIIENFYEPMTKLGYRPRGECLDAPVPGTPGRFYFSKNIDGVRSHQVHICQDGHFDAKEKLLFRNYLRAHPIEAQEYSSLKERLAKGNLYDITGYIYGKDKFIREIIDKAKVWRNC